MLLSSGSMLPLLMKLLFQLFQTALASALAGSLLSTRFVLPAICQKFVGGLKVGGVSFVAYTCQDYSHLNVYLVLLSVYTQSMPSCRKGSNS